MGLMREQKLRFFSSMHTVSNNSLATPSTTSALHLLQAIGLPVCMVVAGLASGPVSAADSNLASSPLRAIGIIAHDQGPFSDHNEHGIDLNLEVQSAPLDFFGQPRAHFGATLNFNGQTNTVYGGLTVPLYTLDRWFLDGFIGVAVHDGPLHKDSAACTLYSDCGYGSRVLPRFGMELGHRLDARSAVSLFLDHMSHKWVISGENEGLDQAGLRYLHSF